MIYIYIYIYIYSYSVFIYIYIYQWKTGAGGGRASTSETFQERIHKAGNSKTLLLSIRCLASRGLQVDYILPNWFSSEASEGERARAREK